MKTKVKPLLLLSLMSISPLSAIHAQELGSEPVVLTTSANEFFVALNGLRVRSTPEDAGKTMGVLSLNEKVRVVSPELINGKYVQIEIIATANKIISAERYYVVQEYLSAKVIDYKEFVGKYFVVVNVATETLRLYERQCLDNSCPSKMVMETEVVVGEDRDHPAAEKGKGRSIVGSYRVTGWAKFYQDGGGHYPAWYKDGYPMPPEIGDNNWNDWFKKKYMPEDANGEKHGAMRGAFGWYTAFVAPGSFGQWTHGTIGWGENKDEFIQQTKKFVANVVSNPRSSGCTRNNNEAIAFIREMIDTGTPIIKIYAKEELLDKKLSDYTEETKPWQYILTKKAGERSGRANVLKSLGVTGTEADMFWSAKRAGSDMIIDPASALNQILEVGTYDVDVMPTVIKYTPGEDMGKIKRSIGRKGNVYGVKSKDMSSGVFYVDAGVLSDYHHPKAILEVSGFEDEETPPWMDSKNIK